MVDQHQTVANDAASVARHCYETRRAIASPVMVVTIRRSCSSISNAIKIAPASLPLIE